MRQDYSLAQKLLRENPKRWLVTGAAGFIGSHLVEALLRLRQHVVALDDFSTGSHAKLDAAKQALEDPLASTLDFREGSVLDSRFCKEAVEGVDIVIHQAGFVSVPLSVAQPAACMQVNVAGTHNLLEACAASAGQRFVYASSSAVYGDNNSTQLQEELVGNLLSPYAISKKVSEMYADMFARQYGLTCAGLRYFNVFGPRQSAEGGYAAVIPSWIHRMLSGAPCQINGTGDATRDFCHVRDVVQANILAALGKIPGSRVYNVGNGRSVSLLQLHATLAKLVKAKTGYTVALPIHGPARPADIEHSSASISRISSELGFCPTVDLEQGLEETLRAEHFGA